MPDQPDHFCRKIDEALSELRTKFSDRADADECLDWELYFTLKSLRIKTMLLQTECERWRKNLPPMPESEAFSRFTRYFAEWDYASPPLADEDISTSAQSALARIRQTLVACARSRTAPHAEDLLW